MPASSTTWLLRTTSGLCLTLLALVALPAVAQAAAPINDAFADAQVVRVGDRATGTLAAATLEAGEPATSSPQIVGSVWYALEPTTTEPVRVDTCGRNSNSELAVFTGDGPATLTELTHSQSDCTGGGRVYFTATAATTFHIRVSGYAWASDFALTVARPQAPANDDFAGAQAIGMPAKIAGSTVDATLEPGEPEPSPYGSGHSVWYRVTPATGESVRLSICGDLSNSFLTVYSGTSVTALTDVSRTTDLCGFRNIVDFTPVANRTYYIAVRGNGHTANDFAFDVSGPSPLPTAPPAGAPPNPRCPFQLAAPGSITYRGTHSGGGEVCVTVNPGFAGVAWFHLVDPDPDLCIPFAVEHYEPALAIVARRFAASTSSAKVTGTFGGQSVSGTFQAAIPPGGAGICSGRVVRWTATTQVIPPPAISDETPPALRVRGAITQRALHAGRVVVTVRCPREACAATASATIAGVRRSSALAVLRANVARTLTLRLSASARRALRRALRSHTSLRTRVTVLATDVAGNTTRARRTITLRR